MTLDELRKICDAYENGEPIEPVTVFRAARSALPVLLDFVDACHTLVDGHNEHDLWQELSNLDTAIGGMDE